MRTTPIAILGAFCWLTVQPRLHAQEACPEGWVLEETLRIGSIDGDDALSNVLSLTVGPGGAIYVGQTFVPHVAVFSAEGRLVERIGRGGSGPGEFEVAALRLGWIGDTLWARDLNRMQFFAPDGSATRQVAFLALDRNEASHFGPGVPLLDGTFLGDRGLSGGTAPFFQAERLSLPRFSADGEFLDTLAMIPQLPRVEHSGVAAGHPLGDWTDVSMLPVAATTDGSAVLLVGEVRGFDRQPTFDLVKIGAAGDTLLKRPVAYEPRPVSRSEREWMTDVFGARAGGEYSQGPRPFWRSDAENQRRRRAAREAIWFPDYHPPVRRIVGGSDGSIWLLRELRLPERHDRWELYDAAGSYQGHVVIEEGMSDFVPWAPRLDVLHATRDEIWGTTIDSLGVAYIHRYRTERRCR